MAEGKLKPRTSSHGDPARGPNSEPSPEPGADRLRLQPTWSAPTTGSMARRYRRPGGPWEGPTLDELAGGAELVADGRRLSREASADVVARLAGGLRARGVGRGDVVAWQLPNGLTPALLFRACWRLGAVASPVLHNVGPTEVEAALEQVDPVLRLGPEDVPDDVERLVEQWGGPPVPVTLTKARPADLAVVLFTSGSTGVPKAVLHTHRGLSWKARLMARVHDLGPGDTVLMPSPMAHIAGLLNGLLLPSAAGMTSLLVRRFDPDQALSQVADERVSFLAGPPTFFVAMSRAKADRPEADTSSLRLISSGGAAVTPAFVESTGEALGCRVKRTYGSTEAPTVTTSTNADPLTRARDTEGRAVGEVELRITDPSSGRALPHGPEPGELWVRGPELFVGYASVDQTAEVTAPGGWFRTGDLATVDPAGWLRIVGRLKDVIIRGGENIAASEVEAVLEAHPAIHQAVAVGYPDPLMGERVMAFVVADEAFDLECCREWFVARGVTRFKTPERVTCLDQMPLLGTGKPDRAALRERAAEER